jgi:signal transduction histidine kinase
VADCLRRHKQEAEDAGIGIQTLKRSGPAVVSADPHRLAQILDNLLDNAISYAGKGADVSVTVAQGDPVTITVADSGRGIAAKDLPYVFDAFYRGDAARTPGEHHSGLGLRIARGLAEAHGGALRIESVEGEGTRAILTLPQATTDADITEDG